MKMKSKILLGFLLIIVMLIIAGTMSIIEFIRISNSVGGLLKNNYKSIEAAKTMIESLEREDSGILLNLTGHKKEGNGIIQSADSAFSKAFLIASNNVTEENEQDIINEINSVYNDYKQGWEMLYKDDTVRCNTEVYFEGHHMKFLECKQIVHSLLNLNQSAMYHSATDLKERSQRSVMPGIVAIVSALVFLLMFNFFITIYLFGPFKRIIKGLKGHQYDKGDFDPQTPLRDEFRELDTEIKQLSNRLRNLNKNN